jgi:hypothetical protein
MVPAVKGLLLGMANTFAIAMVNALAAATNTDVGRNRILRGSAPDPLELFMIVTLFGLFPAMFTGLFVGWLAGVTRGRSHRVRLAVIAVPAVGLVAFLGAATRSPTLIALSCIPTFVAVSILERWTRAPLAMPIARTT